MIRWNNPEVGLVKPLEFIPLAEETGLMVPLGNWVINTACQVGYKLNKVYGLNLNMSVHLSPSQLKQKDFYEVISKLIKRSGIQSYNLELEVPKSVFKFDKVLGVLKTLKEDGIRITLTDFGTAKISISDLKKMPINMVKLDREFIHDIDETRPQKLLAAESIISLVHKLNLELIASGVENKQQFDYLIKGKCDIIQGYFFEEPVPLELLEGIIRKGILENEALSQVIQRAGLTYEGFVRQERQRIGKKWDLKL